VYSLNNLIKYLFKSKVSETNLSISQVETNLPSNRDTLISPVADYDEMMNSI